MGNAPGTTQLVNVQRSHGQEGMSSFQYGTSPPSYETGYSRSSSGDHCSYKNGMADRLSLPQTSLSATFSPMSSTPDSSPLPIGSPMEFNMSAPHVVLPTLYEHAITPPDTVAHSTNEVDMIPDCGNASTMSLGNPLEEKTPLPSCFHEKFNVDVLAGRLHGTSLNEAIQNDVAKMENRLPCVFKWCSGGHEVFLVGSFNNWSTPIPMVKSDDCYYVIVKLWPGRHEYKFNVDGRWYHDHSQPTVCNEYGTLNNVVEVRPSDFNVMDALEADILECQNRGLSRKAGTSNQSARRFRSVSGGSSQLGTSFGSGRCRMLSQSDDEDYGQVLPSAVVMTPPQLPQQLLQANLNSETSRICDPNLLPAPHHVMVNHLYALSIKDGVIVLSCITRFRNKFVTTVYYKPI